MNGAVFSRVPDFIQAHFGEAPRLDLIGIGRKYVETAFADGTPSSIHVPPGEDRNRQQHNRFRALKRMANQGHDHLKEIDFYIEELKFGSGTGREVLRWIYLLISDYGRSLCRPMFWLVFLVVSMAWAYMSSHFYIRESTEMGYVFNTGESMLILVLHQLENTEKCLLDIAQTLGTLFEVVVNGMRLCCRLLGIYDTLEVPRCLVGEGEAWKAAFSISIQKALPFTGVGLSDKLRQDYACLYGIHGVFVPHNALPASFSPVIPESVQYLGIIQSILGLILTFVLALAVKNYFRIK